MNSKDIDPFTTRSVSLRRGPCYLAPTPVPTGGVRLDAFTVTVPRKHLDSLSTLVPPDAILAALGRPLRGTETLIRADRYDRNSSEGLGVMYPLLFDTGLALVHDGVELRVIDIDDEEILALRPPCPLNPALVSVPCLD